MTQAALNQDLIGQTDADEAALPPAAPNVSDATRLADGLINTMKALLEIVESETELVRAGKVDEAIELETEKTELSRDYMRSVEQLKTGTLSLQGTTPDLLTALRHHHDAFQAMLQANLKVLATAHAVSEGIVRGVNGELQRKQMPQTYTAKGQRTAPGARHTTPLAVSRTL